MDTLPTLLQTITTQPSYQLYGTISAVKGLLLECRGLEKRLSIGSRCNAQTRSGRSILCEVVGFNGENALLMPYAELEGIGPGCKVEFISEKMASYPSEAWLGRVVNALGEPIDELGALINGTTPYTYKNSPPSAHIRQRIGGKLDTGVRAINTFITCCTGQRMGIFSGSGVGKSTMISMFARYSNADVIVIGLIGERGREVQEFLQDDLGEEGLSRSVVVVATSDEPALMRKQAAYLTLSVAEYFRDQGKHVLCLMDSLTRFAMAQREIGLSAGEPPTSKGYPPTVFAELPRLLERAGPGPKGSGNITGLFTVLVEGDDHNEPISDAVRGIVDGHIVMDRKIGERGRYPAINVLRSVSRTLPECNSDAENALTRKARQLMSTYDDMEDMIRLGAYRQGSDQSVDEAIHFHAALEQFLAQTKHENTPLEECYAKLAAVLGIDNWYELTRPKTENTENTENNE